MEYSEEKGKLFKNILPRSTPSPIRGVSFSIENKPAPSSWFINNLKDNLDKLNINQCLKLTLNSDRTLTDWQRYISSICSNYSKKTNREIRFTVRIIDNDSIGVWRIK